MTNKPYKGKIYNWRKDYFDQDDIRGHYPGENLGLGFFIQGDSVGHPEFTGVSGFHTSWVVKVSEPDKFGDREIETRNSRYKPVGEEVG